jgi:hypothetical protein
MKNCSMMSAKLLIIILMYMFLITREASFLLLSGFILFKSVISSIEFLCRRRRLKLRVCLECLEQHFIFFVPRYSACLDWVWWFRLTWVFLAAVFL